LLLEGLVFHRTTIALPYRLKGDSGTKNDANFSRNNATMTDYFNHRFMRMQQKLTDVVFDNIEKHIDCMISGGWMG
jgi:hypothetical protein